MSINKLSKGSFSLKDIKFCGKTCKNPSITILDNTSNIAIKCIGGCEYETSFIEDGNLHCVKVLISCDDGDSCGYKEEKEICFCSDGGCGPCKACENGICVDLCNSNEICGENGSCIPTDCGEGYIATSSGCLCPSGIELNGRCLECDDTTELPTCSECINGKITYKDCGDYQCDNEDGICKECVDGTPCINRIDGRNCCKDNKCSCCDGFVFDQVLRTCVEEPECSNSEDCGDCRDCVNGKCTDRVCPTGFICVPGFDKCLPECDCNSRSCTNGSSSCTDHPTIDGKCYCHNCGDSDCTNEGGECGPTNDRDACICNDNVCEPNPCNGVRCPQGLVCINGKCTGPDGGTGGPGAGNCPNQFNIQKNDDDCSLTGSLVNGCCVCPAVSGKLNYTYNATNTNNVSVTATLDYLKGSSCASGLDFNQDTLQDIALNEFISGGALYIKYISTWRERVVTPGPNGDIITFVNQSQEFTDTTGTDVNTTTNQSTINSSFTFVPTSSDIDNITHTVKIYRRDFTINGAGCTYDQSLIKEFNVVQNQISTDKTECISLSSDDCAKAFIKWIQDGVVRRKLYTNTPDTITIDNSGSNFGGIRRLEPCKVIRIESDCACEPKTSDTDFCNPESPRYNFDIDNNECKNRVEVTLPKSCKLHFENNTKWIVVLNGERVDVTNINGINEIVSNTNDLVTTIQTIDDNPITSIKYYLECADGRIICEKEQRFEFTPVVLPQSLDCVFTSEISDTDTNCGQITFPDSELETITVDGEVVNGLTKVYCGTREKLPVTVTKCDGVSEQFNIPIPSIDDCTLRTIVTDPCSCDSERTLPNGTKCFDEKITWDLFPSGSSAPFNRLVLDDLNVNGNIYDIDGNTLSLSDLQSTIDSQSGNIKTLEFCVSGSYDLIAHVESDIAGVQNLNASNSNTCDFVCCCTVSNLRFVDNFICNDESPILRITGSEECNLSLDVFDISSGAEVFFRTQTLPVNGSGDYPINLPVGRWLVKLKSADNACNTLPSLESSIVIEDLSNYTVTLDECQVVNGTENQFTISVFDGGNPVTSGVTISNATNVNNIGGGVYTGNVSQNSTVEVTVTSTTSDCRQTVYPIIVNCSCDGFVPDITGTSFCSGASSITVGTTVQSGYIASWDYNNGAQTGSGANFTISNPQNGLPVTVVQTATDGSGCSGERTFNLSASGNLDVNINNNVNVGACPEETVTLSTNVNTSGVSYNWTVLNNTATPPVTDSDLGNTWETASADFVIPNPANFPYTIEVTVTDSNGCSGTAEIQIIEGNCNTGCNCTMNVNPIACGAQVTISGDTECGQGSIIASANGMTETYALINNSATIEGDDFNNFNGTYQVTFSPGGTGCNSINQNVNIADCVNPCGNCTVSAVANGCEISVTTNDCQDAGNINLVLNGATQQNVPTNGNETTVLTVTQDGNYTVQVLNANGCTGASIDNISVTDCENNNCGTSTVSLSNNYTEVCVGNNARLNGGVLINPSCTGCCSGTLTYGYDMILDGVTVESFSNLTRGAGCSSFSAGAGLNLPCNQTGTYQFVLTQYDFSDPNCSGPTIPTSISGTYDTNTLTCCGAACNDPVTFPDSSSNNITLTCNSGATNSINIVASNFVDNNCTGCCDGNIGTIQVSGSITSSNPSFTTHNISGGTVAIDCNGVSGNFSSIFRDCTSNEIQAGDVITNTIDYVVNVTDCAYNGPTSFSKTINYTVTASDVNCC